MTETIVRELATPSDAAIEPARELYESVLDEAERIPWEWLARTAERRRDWHPGERRSHLVVATPKDRPLSPNGFGYGAFLPAYGGYVCYLGVDPASRGQGIGALLFRFIFGLIEDAARQSGMPLPYIIWESHRPADVALWQARVKLFDRVGGMWVRGIEMLTPNYMHANAPPVRLNLFIRPWDEPATAFDADHLRAAVAGLYQQIYRIPLDDSLHRETMAAAVNPRLAPAVEAVEEG